MRKFMLFCSALLCGVGLAYAGDDNSEATVRFESELPTGTYEDAKPASLQGEQPAMPLKVDAGVLKLTFSGYAQASYTYDAAARTNDFVADRLILMMDAKIIDKVRMFVMFDAKGASLHEMYGEYAFCPEIKVRLGQCKQPFMLENITSPTKLNNLQINPTARYLAGMSLDPGMGATAGRDLGFSVLGDLFERDGRRLLNYHIGVFNGCGRGNAFKDNNTQKDFVGMINVLATKQLMFTTSFLFGTGHAKESRNGVFVKDQNYKKRRVCAGFEWTGKPMHLRSEWVYGRDNTTNMYGAYLSGDIHLMPKFDFVFDYDYLDTGNHTATLHDAYLNNRTHTMVAGLSYTIFKLCRVVSEYTCVCPKFGGLQHLWQTQLQVRF